MEKVRIKHSVFIIFYYGKELAQRLGCHKVDTTDINLTPGLLRK